MPESESDLTEIPLSLIRPRAEDDVLLTSLPALSGERLFITHDNNDDNNDDKDEDNNDDNDNDNTVLSLVP